MRLRHVIPDRPVEVVHVPSMPYYFPLKMLRVPWIKGFPSAALSHPIAFFRPQVKHNVHTPRPGKYSVVFNPRTNPAPPPEMALLYLGWYALYDINSGGQLTNCFCTVKSLQQYAAGLDDRTVRRFTQLSFETLAEVIDFTPVDIPVHAVHVNFVHWLNGVTGHVKNRYVLPPATGVSLHDLNMEVKHITPENVHLHRTVGAPGLSPNWVTQGDTVARASHEAGQWARGVLDENDFPRFSTGTTK